MKKILISATFLFVSLSVCAQQKAGTFSITPKVGISVSSFSGAMPNDMGLFVNNAEKTLDDMILYKEIDPTSSETGSFGFNKRKNKVGFTVGAEGHYQMSDVFGLSLGALFTQQGSSYDMKGYTFMGGDGLEIANYDDMNITLNCITVPVLVNAYVWKGLAVKVGIQPEFAVSKRAKLNTKISYKDSFRLFSDYEYKGAKSFSLSVPVGASYEYKNIVADLRYIVGLTDLRNDGDSKVDGDAGITSRNSTLLFTIGYTFNL